MIIVMAAFGATFNTDKNEEVFKEILEDDRSFEDDIRMDWIKNIRDHSKNYFAIYTEIWH